MRVRQLIELLGQFNREADVLVSCDEELNTLYRDVQVSKLVMDGDTDDKGENHIVIWGNSGSEAD